MTQVDDFYITWLYLLMHIPLNVIHLYIGIPVIGGVSIEIFRRNRKQPNITTHYLSICFLLFTLDMASFGLPALFTRDPLILSFGTFMGDCSYVAALLFLWFICIKTYLATKPRLKLIISVLVTLLTMAIMVEAIPRDLRPPYSTHIIDTTHNGIALIYRDTVAYKIMNGLDSLVFLWIGYIFWQQARSAPTRLQKWRIWSLAVAALLGASSIIIAPAMPVDRQLVVSAILWSVGLLTVLTTALFSLFMRPKLLKQKG